MKLQNALKMARDFIKTTGHEVSRVTLNEYGVELELDGVELIVFRVAGDKVEIEKVAA